MITEYDLNAAIAECKGDPKPNANTCIKLAAYYIIRNEMYGQPAYSFAASAEPAETIIEYDSGTEFSEAIKGMSYEKVLPILDEIMSSVQILQPRLYAAAMRKLQE